MDDITIHSLKTEIDFFQAVASGAKRYEIRFNDRNFKIGDELILLETLHTVYTGRSIIKHISHILTGPVWGLKEGWVILSFAI